MYDLVWFSFMSYQKKKKKEKKKERIFNAKYPLYIYSNHIGFGLVWFYGISTIVGYFLPNPVYTYIFDI